MTNKYRVVFPNNTDIITTASAIKKYFDADSDIRVEILEEEFFMDKHNLRLHNNRFDTLVGAIDAKWGYSYEPVTQEPSPVVTPELDTYMMKLEDS